MGTNDPRTHGPREHIAVVGLSCRFPGAPDADAFWEMISEGGEPVTFFSPEELRAAGVPERLTGHPDYVPAQGIIEEADAFDASFFGISPKEADIMDPQHRVLLECAWAALEDAGYDCERTPGPVGVYAGGYRNDHLSLVPTGGDEAAAFARNIANEADYLATRISYKLNLTGPSVNVQTACSTSLVAVHLACQSLLLGESRMALAGGVTLRAGQHPGYIFQRGGILSPDGRCRAFDVGSEGTVIGDGAGIVVLKRLSDALADGDTVRAVILGSAVGNDGGDRVGFTAPGVAGQAAIVTRALRSAGISPDTVGYVETHGSATPLGDRIEVDALTRAFSAAGGTAERAERCLIGSVKTNIGHTHAAAGIAGFIKTVLALQHRTVPPSLYFERPSPRIDFASSPFAVASARTGWPQGGELPLRAGVSSFGLGGTGAHAVLQQAPAPDVDRTSGSGAPCVLPLSAPDPSALEEQRKRLAAHLSELPETPAARLGDVAHTLQAGRRRFAHRLVVVAATLDEAAETLRTADPRTMLRGQAPRSEPRVSMMFPGLGDQYVQMGRELRSTQPEFRAAIEECDVLLRELGALPVSGVLYPDETPARRTGGMDLRRLMRGDGGGEEDPLRATHVAQPALFAVEYALARLWMSRGVRPRALIGYSLGEYVAACLSGVLDLKDALHLVNRRAELIDRLPRGAMLAVPLPEEEVRPWLTAAVSLAAVNGPKLCVLAGEPAAVAKLAGELASRKVASRELSVSHAFHSHLMEPVVEEYTALVREVELSPPGIPYVSNVTGDWITAEEATDPAYYGRHLRQPVRFVEGLVRLREQTGNNVLLEAGPGNALGSLARQTRAEASRDAEACPVVGSLPASFDNRPEEEFFQTSTARLWLAGVPVQWPAASGGVRPRRVPLPTYPFQRRRHDVRGVVGGTDGLEPAGGPSSSRTAGGLGSKRPLADWFSVPVWQATTPVVPVAAPSGTATGQTFDWLLFTDTHGVGDGLATLLRERGHRVTTVRAGHTFARNDAHDYAVSPACPEDYRRLFSELRQEAALPEHVVHLWQITTREDTDSGWLRDTGFHSLLTLARCASPESPDQRLSVTVVTSDLHPVDGSPAHHAERAAVQGPCQAWPLEAQGVTCRTVDIGLAEACAPALLREILEGGDGEPVALRGTRRWRRTHLPFRLDGEDTGMAPLRESGVYLLTGGLGGIGLSFARHLAQHYRATLVLTTRTATTDANQADREALRSELEAAGGTVRIVQADVTDAARMRALVRDMVEEHGAVHGIVHAAGVPGGGVLQLKQPAEADAVLAPKVDGALALRAACQDVQGVDFLLLCSSLLSVTGGLGQADYSGANAVLDTLAEQSRQGADSTHVVSVNWDAWREVGMSVRMARGEGPWPADQPAERTASASGRNHDVRLPWETGHPLLTRLVAEGPQRSVHAGDFSARESWLVDEHRMEGLPVVPGASHLELVRAAVAQRAGAQTGEIRDVTFLTPIVAGEEEPTEVRVVLDSDGQDPDELEFAVVSSYRDPGSGERRWQQNSTGRVRTGKAPAPGRRHDIPRLIRDAGMQDLGIPRHEGPMSFGPRSRCLERLYAGNGEFLAVLGLPEEFAADLDKLSMHPSLVDLATAFVGLHLAEEFRIPILYGTVRALRPLPRRVVSYQRYREGDAAGRQTVTADVTVMDEDGQELLLIEGFVLKRAGDLGRRLHGARMGKAAEIVPYRFDPLPLGGYERGRRVPATQPEFLEQQLKYGITPEEGVVAIGRILASGPPPRVVVCTQELDAVVAQARTTYHSTGSERVAAVSPTHPRPTLPTPFVEPSDGLARRMACIWATLLGIDRVGLHDDFFELGGHSLLGIQLVARLREDFGVELSPASLFEALTVARLVKLVEDRLPVS
ncbi:SDR family NAD(P)-dependent oxidoreductase [Streptomyces sp. NPDC048611]|uniref:type I polyketide synthase n=1 Tax=Streptomyces sp. NPDC048611 TaxID=3155635 RepID=UPI003424C41D